MTAQSIIVNATIDSLDLRVSRNREPSQWMLDRAQEWRAAFEAWWESRGKHREAPTVELPDIGTFRVQPSSLPYEFVLINPEICDIRIWNPQKWPVAVGTETGQFYISFRSQYLQFNNPDDAVNTLVSALESLMLGGAFREFGYDVQNTEFNRITRVDLAVDTQDERAMNVVDIDAFVYRARKVQWKTADAINDEIENAALDFLRAERGAVKATGAATKNEKHGVPPTDNKGGSNAMRETLAALANSANPERSLRRFAIALAKQWGVGADREHWVHTGSRRLETVYFGRYGSQLYARRYDKLATLEIQSKEYMRDVWVAGGWDGESPVWRTEFSLSGDFLRHLELEPPGATEPIRLDLREYAYFAALIPQIWAYLTGSWLRHTIPTNDRRSRWKTSAFWSLIQTAFGNGMPARRYKPAPRPNLDGLLAQFKGLYISLAAIRGSLRYNDPMLEMPRDEIPDPVLPLLGEVLEYMATHEAQEKLLKRTVLYGLDGVTDTHYSAVLRTQRLASGDGS